MSIVEEQGCFQTKLRIVGNSNKLIYFCRQLHDFTALSFFILKPISNLLSLSPFTEETHALM